MLDLYITYRMTLLRISIDFTFEKSHFLPLPANVENSHTTERMGPCPIVCWRNPRLASHFQPSQPTRWAWRHWTDPLWWLSNTTLTHGTIYSTCHWFSHVHWIKRFSIIIFCAQITITLNFSHAFQPLIVINNSLSSLHLDWLFDLSNCTKLNLRDLYTYTMTSPNLRVATHAHCQIRPSSSPEVCYSIFGPLPFFLTGL